MIWPFGFPTIGSTSTTSMWCRHLRPSIQTSRVGQLDADLLDEELQSMLVEPFWAVLTPVLGTEWRLELIALLKILMVRWSLQRSCSYGAQLQNLKWKTVGNARALSSNQIVAYSLLTVLPTYLGTRLRDYMLASGWADYPTPPSWCSLISNNRLQRNRYWKRLAWGCNEKIEQIYSTLNLLNFLAFLFNGKYRSLLERILGIRLIYANQSAFRNVDFEFLNQQLVWDTVIEFLLSVLPLINLRRLQLRLINAKTRTLPAIRNFFRSSQSSSKTSKNKLDANPPKKGPFSHLSNDICPICTAKKASPTPMTSTVINSNDPMSFASSIPGSNHMDVRAKVPYKMGLLEVWKGSACSD
ncbi:hypothetical protein O181_024978 [Austropuccinia psidii MF-1]|uniref:RING-type E3 ubiquitin transferase (cysteine targeting) n=1 Tax=Austropuccinia psidii MF-1 TaxID=1389203 RepID=A0A9Q3CLT3_9BASI|nr:hypothetical protein [Austropuccinia psidii MF-1]